MTDKPLPLTIVGIECIDQFVSGCKVSDQITCIRYIESNEAFHKLIHEARLFVFLSFIEGFGFPPIEAMQLETPVLCSRHKLSAGGCGRCRRLRQSRGY